MGSVGYKVTGEDYAHPLISERAIDEPRPLRVIYIGAGVSGINAAIQFPRILPKIELAIYEKNPEVGGTWFENVRVLISMPNVWMACLRPSEIPWLRVW